MTASALHRGTTTTPRAKRRLVRTLTLACMLMTLGGAAWAIWSSMGGGLGSATTGTLASPTELAVTSPSGSSSVAASWSPPTSGIAPQGFYVVRTSTSTGVSAPACSSSSAQLITTTSCTDANVSDGSYTYTVTAVRGGWSAASGSSAPVIVSAAVATTTTLTSSPNPSTTTQVVTFTATVTPASGTGVPAGTIVFKDGSTPISCSGGSQTLNAAGAATCTLTYAVSGSHSITATYAGSAAFATSTSAPITQIVNLSGQTITITSTPPSAAVYGGPSYTVSATATSGLPVVFSSATGTVCAVSGSSVSFVGVGTCTLNADQSGNSQYAAATTAQQSFSVGKASQSITFTSAAPTNAVTGGPTYAVSATATSGLTVAFTSATPASCTVNGTVVSFVGAGTCTINANQAGNGLYNAAPQTQQSFAVRTSQSITFTSTPPATATATGTSYVVTATASSGLAVSFSSGSTSVCTVTGSTVSFVTAGTCLVNADQAGNGTFAPAPQKQQTFSVSAAPGAPQNLAIRNDGSNKITATWTVVAGESYECQTTSNATAPSAGSWSACVSGSQFTGQNGTRTFYVRATRGGATSSFSSLGFSA